MVNTSLLPARAGAAAAFVPAAPTYAPPPAAYAPAPPTYAPAPASVPVARTGYWRQTLDRCVTFVDKAEAKEAKAKEEEENERKKKEEEKNREEFERKELKTERSRGQEMLSGMKAEIGLLRKEKMRSMEETESWRNEALRPGNKRGTISISTPECDDRLRSRQRVMMSPSIELREEMWKMKDSEYCTMRELEVLKQRKVEAEVKGIEAERRKLEAEAEITRLREQVEKLSMEVATVPTGGTNLKGKLEAVVGSGQKTVRRGRPRLTPAKTPRKDDVRKDDAMTDANDRFIFLREEKKRLRALKKSGLEAICQQEGIEYKTVESTADELAEIRANARFGKQGRGLDDSGSEPSTSGGTNETPAEVENWKLLKRCYGGSVVSTSFGTAQLRRSRGWLADGVKLEFTTVISFCSSLSVFKPDLARLLSYPPSRKEIFAWDFERLVWMFSVVRSFSEKRTRYTLRCLISGVLRRRFDVNIRSRLVIRITYCECLNKTGIRKLCATMINKLDIVEGWKWMMVRRMRLVWKKNVSVGGILYNFRKAAREGDVKCKCGDADGTFPRKDRHVCFRMSEVGFVPAWLKNAKNIPKPSRQCTVGGLKKQIIAAFEPFVTVNSVTRDEIGHLLSGQLLRDCFNRAATDNEVVCSTDEAYLWKERFGSLVCCPIDHNPGDSLVCCPSVYQAGMRKMFLGNDGFETCLEGKEEINTRNGIQYREMDFESLGKWDSKGKLGRCYVVPKHKDTNRWRPICPTYEECGVVASKRVSRAVNRLLWDLPLRSNFNLRSTEELVERIAGVNKELKKDEAFVGAAFDIKEMLCNLPHDVIMKAVEWVLDYWTAQGAKGVLLKRRAGVVFRQRMGIPMGKASSPALACLLSAYSEFTFLNSLGSERNLTHGVRIVDDVSIFVRYKKKDEKSRRMAEEVIRKFENCYHKNLVLERTDKGGVWDFLGCVVGVRDWPDGIVCAATHKNQGGVWEGRLTFQNLQDYCTYSSRQQKLAVIASFFYRAKRYTTMRGAEAIFLLTLKIELRLRGFPDGYFDTALSNFSSKFGGLWEDWVQCLTGWEQCAWKKR
ncbi:hypothetical protein CBR_g48614 [Chara braunii]|uniref:Reverse transcriptase domain-containing protein n=1 Tax=Chara braunii TaxID=69332 RepID=A0A388M3D4_CHABU|nr:hypothetical protein CBR_g48614 [Chara braunii]|eukprot:GBG89005.1 hypothetical protein CBR_g48614 [Chara braunii]